MNFDPGNCLLSRRISFLVSSAPAGDYVAIAAGDYHSLAITNYAGDFVSPYGVDFLDFAVLGLAWYSQLGDGNWNAICDISEPNDNVIDELDLEVFVGNWQRGVE